MPQDLDKLIAARVTGLDRPLIVAIDGRSGVGKSTVAAALAGRHEGQAIASDDFFCGRDRDELSSLTPPERAEVCIDWRRLRAEVLEPLRAGRIARWRTFNWTTGIGLSDHELSCPPVSVVIVDGAYSARPELADIVDVSVLVTLEDETRRKRLLSREGARFVGEWHSLWDAAEEHYFGRVRPPGSFDVILARSDDEDGLS